MKNLFIVIALAVIGFLIYHFALKAPSEQAGQPPASQVPQSSPSIAVDPSLVSTSPDNADVFILEPGDGTTVSSPVTVKFGITNMSVAKAGDNQPNSGHHHLLIDLEELPPLDAPLPATDQLIHFGGAQTQTTIELDPGQHTLQLLLGNYLHIPHDKPVVSKKITITVE